MISSARLRTAAGRTGIVLRSPRASTISPVESMSPLPPATRGAPARHPAAPREETVQRPGARQAGPARVGFRLSEKGPAGWLYYPAEIDDIDQRRPRWRARDPESVHDCLHAGEPDARRHLLLSDSRDGVGPGRSEGPDPAGYRASSEAATMIAVHCFTTMNHEAMMGPCGPRPLPAGALAGGGASAAGGGTGPSLRLTGVDVACLRIHRNRLRAGERRDSGDHGLARRARPGGRP